MSCPAAALLIHILCVLLLLPSCTPASWLSTGYSTSNTPSNKRGVRSSSSGENAKPDYCRPDLPGCCPKVVSQVFFLHIEKTGGTHLRSIIKEAVAQKLPGSYMCSYLSHMPYACTPSTNRTQSQTCNQRNYAYYKSHINTGKHFKGRCSITAGHQDMKMFDAFPSSVQQTTLLITNLREPVARLVSHYHMLRRHNYTPAFEQDVGSLFLRDARGVAMCRNKMSRVMSGQFCCKDGLGIDYEAESVLKDALKALDKFCVVGLTERMQESVEYMHFALGIPPPVNRKKEGNSSLNVYDVVRDAVTDELKAFNQLDVDLFKRVHERFEQQMAVMRSA